MLDSRPVSTFHCSFREGVVYLSLSLTVTLVVRLPYHSCSFSFGPTITRGEGASLRKENVNNGTRPTR